MRTVKLSAFYLICVGILLASGCVAEQEYNDLKIQNNTQRKRIADLESRMQATKLKLEQLKRKLDTIGSRNKVESDTLNQKIITLERDLLKKKGLIASMQQRLLYGGASLPVELSTLLEDFAKSREMVTFDSARGVVKFKSDLLFERGSDKVAGAAAQAVKLLCAIFNSKEAGKFDIIIAGHTDDIRISKPATRTKHPSNWHLSAHRAISVLNVMTKNKVAAGRLSIRGFGEYRPIEPNKANKKGNPKNRRVEIYIVAKGI